MKQLLMTVSDLFFLFLHLLIMQRCMTAFLGPGKRSYKSVIAWMGYYIFLFLTNKVFHVSPLVLITGNIILVFLISTVTARKSIKLRCMFTILICSVWMLVEVLCAMVLTVAGAQNATLSDAGNVISKLCMLLLSVLISHYMKVKNSPEISLRYFLVILLVPASSIYIMHNIFIIAAVYDEFSKFSVFSSLMLLLVNYVVFEIYDWMSRDAMVREQNRLYGQQLELCSRQAEERESLYLEIRRLRHDMKNYLSCLLGAVQTGEKKEAEMLIQEMLNDGISNRTSEVSRSGNIVVDSLVNYKHDLAEKEGIMFEANVFIPVSLPFQSGHLAVILGNLLDNALEACRGVPEGQRYIKLDISYVKEMLQICIRNSYHATHRKDSSGRYLTTKKDTLDHGIGLSSVEQAVSCYHGEMTAEGTGNEFRVSVVMYGSDGEK
jgi:sensor histidine kinase YesM